MNLVKLVRKSDGKTFQGFLAWDQIQSRQMNFYYYDDARDGWVSDNLGAFRPESLPVAEEESGKKVLGE